MILKGTSLDQGQINQTNMNKQNEADVTLIQKVAALNQ